MGVPIGEPQELSEYAKEQGIHLDAVRTQGLNTSRLLTQTLLFAEPGTCFRWSIGMRDK